MCLFSHLNLYILPLILGMDHTHTHFRTHFGTRSTPNRVKGNNFTIPNLLNVPADSDTAKYFDDASLAIFRLAPADYHRFHSPIDGEIGEIVDVPGQYYTGALHS